MTSTILVTKLFIPTTRPELVPRPGLIERLNDGLDSKLSLISAPAGFGKTTLVSKWINDFDLSVTNENKRVNKVAWLSLDDADNDPVRFFVYLIAALQTIEPNIAAGVLNTLQSPQPPSTESSLTALINEIATLTNRVVLILDDYHLIEARPVHDAMSFLLENMPPQMHLVIITREDPPIPLARLRARGQLTELRAADLRFSIPEATQFLNQVMGLNLSPEDIAALETRTEGWIAGLQMAALALQGTLSMQGRDDTTSFIRALTGSHRFVLDYLVEEVLQRQPEHIRSFLLQTAILDRLCGPLCDAVRFGTSGSQEDGKGMLEALERANLFVIPLDEIRQWYRYHHLFAEVLQAHLMDEQPDQVPILHQRASEWYEQNGLLSDAVRHALVTNDLARVADLAELAWQAMDSSFQFGTWLGWVKMLPDNLIRTRPVLSTQYAVALSDAGELEASEARLQDAERWLDPDGDVSVQPEGSGMVVVDEEQFQSLPAKIAIVRADIAQVRGDVTNTMKYAEQALKLTPQEDLFGRAQATVTLGFTYWMSGDLETARKAIADWINSMHQVGNIIFAIASTYPLADIMVAQGQLQEAIKTYQQALQLASAQDEHVQRIIAHLYLGLAMLYHETGDQENAAQLIETSRELGKQNTLIDWPTRWCRAQARLRESEGDLEAVLDLLDEAQRLYVRNPVPDIRPIKALKANVYLKQGRLTKALDWVHAQGLSVEDELSYLREFEHITLSRVLTAEYKTNHADHTILQAIGLLERLLQAAEEGGRMGSVIEILVVQALAYQAQEDIHAALASLERALKLAEPQGYVRIFVDEGAPMQALLREAARQGILTGYIRQLSKSFDRSEGSPVTQPLIEPLSERELEVLRLLGTELNGPEIARELMVSLSTMRTHTRNIYNKLGVNNRRAAVRRADELNLM